jgi:hypothetical protein
MAETELVKKLRIKPGQRIALLHAPEGYRQWLGELPENNVVEENSIGQFDMIQAFFTHKADLDAQVAELKRALAGQAILWVAYPKGGAKAKKETDLNRDILAAFLREKGLEAVAQISVDETWSALRFKPVNGG